MLAFFSTKARLISRPCLMGLVIIAKNYYQMNQAFAVLRHRTQANYALLQGDTQGC